MMELVNGTGITSNWKCSCELGLFKVAAGYDATGPAFVMMVPAIITAEKRGKMRASC